MADNEDPVRLSSTPNSRSSQSSEENSVLNIDTCQSSGPRKSFTGYQCKLCTLVASSQSALDEHMNIHTGSRPYQCLECGFSCSLQSTLQQHLAVHRVEMSSSVLMRSSSVEETQKSPREHVHSLFSDIPRTIPLVSSTGQLLHQEDIIPVPPPMGVFDQTRVFQCKLCTHISPTKTHLNEHMNIHSGKKPYKCLVCGFSSAFRSSLMRHLIVHTGTSKQFKCDQCHYQTPYKCNLQAHKRKRHSSYDNMDTSLSESVHMSAGPEGTKDTHSSLHSDDSQNGSGFPHTSQLSNPFSYQKPPSISGNDQGSPSSDGPIESHSKETQENSTSGKLEHTTSMEENGYSDSTSCQPLPVSTTHDNLLSGKHSSGSGSPTGSSSEVDQPLDRTAEDSTFTTPSSHPTSSGQNGNLEMLNVTSSLQGEVSTPASLPPIASLSQMAHSPLSQQASLPDQMPVVSQFQWSNRIFPIFSKRKERSRKRKSTPIPKRDLVVSPDRDASMWVDTRTGARPFDNQLPQHNSLYIDMTSRNSIKSEDDSNSFSSEQIHATHNGLDLSSPPIPREGVHSTDGMVNHHNSPVNIPPTSVEEAEAYPVYTINPSLTHGMLMNKVSIATQTDYSLFLKGKLEGQAHADPTVSTEVVPPQAAKCPHCETYFTDNVIFTLHMSCHGRAHPFQCGICGYMCGDKIEFTCHITRSKHLR